MPNYLDDSQRYEIEELNRTFMARTEWPTWLLIIGFYLAWAIVVFEELVTGKLASILILIPLVVLWMSLQHESIHGHPTRWPVFNGLLFYLPFAIWYPYFLYRDTHLAHHNDQVLTVPDIDPESRYVTRDRWLRSSRTKRIALWANKTILGRLLIGAPLALGSLIQDEVLTAFKRGGRQKYLWLSHVACVTLILTLVDRYSALSAFEYVFYVSVPALTIGLIRSFYEHKPAPEAAHRTVINESTGPLSWLYLNLNLHLVHHDLPGLPWYHIPRVYKARREAWIERSNGFVVQGYRAIIRKHFLSPVDCPQHPGADMQRNN